ncbi:hypothetical protein JYT51_01055 [Candidatus Amoebophilus asiaticus]|nr:hypothetical protein [Candidatus Amoebophilus asiaticus]
MQKGIYYDTCTTDKEKYVIFFRQASRISYEYSQADIKFFMLIYINGMKEFILGFLLTTKKNNYLQKKYKQYKNIWSFSSTGAHMVGVTISDCHCERGTSEAIS